MKPSFVRACAVVLCAALTLVTALRGQETVRPGPRVELAEHLVEIYDAVGTVTLRHGTGNAVTITATAQGPDGGQLQFQVDHSGDRGRFRVVFPEVEAIASPEGTSGETTDLALRRDGTFGGDRDDGGWRRGRGDRVRVGGSRGFRGWANLEITVPDGREMKVHVAVGHARADGVNGDVTLDTWGADAEATNISGTWLLDTGSGTGTVRGLRSGSLKIDTGSGSATATDIAGDLLDLDTGSGAAEATNVRVERFRFDTGSGPVRARGLTARRGVVDTGSGSADIAYAGGAIEDLSIDTGSGRVNLALPANVDARVTIDTGSGQAVVERTGAVFERRSDDGMVLRFGEGRGRIRIDTGSGGVTIR